MKRYQSNPELIDRIIRHWESYPLEIAVQTDNHLANIHRFGLSLEIPTNGEFIKFRDLMHLTSVFKEVDELNFEWRCKNYRSLSETVEV